MENKVSKNKKLGVEVFVPDSLNVLYTDSAFISAGDFGLTIDFAQRVGGSKKQRVVARVGMSREHAEALQGILQKRLIDMQIANKGKE